MSASTTGGKNEKSRIFEMVFISPGMSDQCKISLKLTRQNVLLLSRLIETGMLEQKGTIGDELIGSISEDSKKEFKSLHEEILNKSGLSELYEKLKAL